MRFTPEYKEDMSTKIEQGLGLIKISNEAWNECPPDERGALIRKNLIAAQRKYHPDKTDNLKLDEKTKNDYASNIGIINGLFSAAEIENTSKFIVTPKVSAGIKANEVAVEKKAADKSKLEEQAKAVAARAALNKEVDKFNDALGYKDSKKTGMDFYLELANDLASERLLALLPSHTDLRGLMIGRAAARPYLHAAIKNEEKAYGSAMLLGFSFPSACAASFLVDQQALLARN